MLSYEDFQKYKEQRQQNPPAIIYKYAPVETACNILRSRKLRFQTPLNYNDPFDSQWDTLWPTRTPAAQNMVANLWLHAIRNPESCPPDTDPARRNAIVSFHDEWIKSGNKRFRLTKPGLKKMLAHIEHERSMGMKGVFEDMIRRMRLCCFCEDNDSILMWSHYACEHRGVVLGFDTGRLEATFHCPFEPVTYSTSMPVLIDLEEWAKACVFGLPNPKPKGERQWGLTKAKVWSYEKEWRFVTVREKGTPGSVTDCEFPNEALVELILGCNFIDTTKKVDVCALATQVHRDVQIRTMRRHRNRFKLVNEPIPSL